LGFASHLLDRNWVLPKILLKANEDDGHAGA
jgi:hypothetical protein